MRCRASSGRLETPSPSSSSTNRGCLDAFGASHLGAAGADAGVGCWDRRDKFSAISCITLSPLQAAPDCTSTIAAQDGPCGGYGRLLEELRRQLRGPFGGVGPAQHPRQVAGGAGVLAKHPEIVAENFPGYMPDLNPDESVWSWTKYGRLSSWAAQNAEECGIMWSKPSST